MLRTVLRALDDDVKRVGPLEVRRYEASIRGAVLNLTRRELELLAALAEHAGHVVPREELYGLVWGRKLEEGDRSVDVYVRKLRAKMAEQAPDWEFLHTHFGLGYRLQPAPSQVLRAPETGS